MGCSSWYYSWKYPYPMEYSSCSLLLSLVGGLPPPLLVPTPPNPPPNPPPPTDNPYTFSRLLLELEFSLEVLLLTHGNRCPHHIEVWPIWVPLKNSLGFPPLGLYLPLCPTPPTPPPPRSSKVAGGTAPWLAEPSDWGELAGREILRNFCQGFPLWDWRFPGVQHSPPAPSILMI